MKEAQSVVVPDDGEKGSPRQVIVHLAYKRIAESRTKLREYSLARHESISQNHWTCIGKASYLIQASYFERTFPAKQRRLRAVHESVVHEAVPAPARPVLENRQFTT